MENAVRSSATRICIPVYLKDFDRAARFKTSLQFIILSHREFYSTLDACKAADYVIFAMSDSVEVDTWGDTLLRTLQAQEGYLPLCLVWRPQAQNPVKKNVPPLQNPCSHSFRISSLHKLGYLTSLQECHHLQTVSAQYGHYVREGLAI